ncbi:VTT domain-containing protein [Arthrobacter sp. fls2-241-R2A-200]|uniref:VTT domain-containing protein n=1 Tax=Arthrobacter sp. fls2-241-R2A-200 TaxID=3040281 RepID=UPI002551A9E7|nr:VTT domain-containing protein [Arthrobacter sp. fls2-241-R2A-200]
MDFSPRFISALGTGRVGAGLLPDWADPAVVLHQPALAPWLLLIIGGFVFAESGLLVGFFLPGDSLLFTAGLLVATGALNINIFLLGALVFVCAFVGDQTGYLIGRKTGPALFRRPDARLFKQERLAKAHAFFDRYGGRAVILARFVPIIRTFTPVVAGAANMSYRTFILFNAMGAFVWGMGMTLLGYGLGQFDWIGKNIDLIFVAIVLVSVVPMIAELIRSKRRQPVTSGSPERN